MFRQHQHQCAFRDVVEPCTRIARSSLRPPSLIRNKTLSLENPDLSGLITRTATEHVPSPGSPVTSRIALIPARTITSPARSIHAPRILFHGTNDFVLLIRPTPLIYYYIITPLIYYYSTLLFVGFYIVYYIPYESNINYCF
jgi:hypothetical protein